MGQRRGRGHGASEHWTEAGGGCRRDRQPCLVTLKPSVPGANVKRPARAVSLPGCARPPAAAGSPAGEVAAAGSAPRERAEPPARPPAHPLGDPASSLRLLEVCKLSPGVPPHHREVGDAGGRFLARRLRRRRRCHRLAALLEAFAPCPVSGGKHTPPIHNCSPCQGNTCALPHTHPRRGDTALTPR